MATEGGVGASLLRWAFRVLIALVFVGLLGVGVLLVVTPSADRAHGVVRALAQKRGIAYPGSAAPERFAKALIATEDKRFLSPLDPGIDAVAIARVVFGRLAGFSDQGGSTIDQQLAKMLFSPREHGLWTELERMAIALKLNAAYDRGEILAMYAELAYYGHGYYGLSAASCGYFGKSPTEMTWSQSAMLAGAVNAPSLDDPILSPSSANARLKHVFGRLVAVGDLRADDANAAQLQPLGLARSRQGADPICR